MQNMTTFEPWNDLLSSIHYELLDMAMKCFKVFGLFSDPFCGSYSDISCNDYEKAEKQLSELVYERFHIDLDYSWFYMEQQIIRNKVLDLMVQSHAESELIDKVGNTKIYAALDDKKNDECYTILSVGSRMPASDTGKKRAVVKVKPGFKRPDYEPVTLVLKSGKNLDSKFEIVYLQEKTFRECSGEVEKVISAK